MYRYQRQTDNYVRLNKTSLFFFSPLTAGPRFFPEMLSHASLTVWEALCILRPSLCGIVILSPFLLTLKQFLFSWCLLWGLWRGMWGVIFPSFIHIQKKSCSVHWHRNEIYKILGSILASLKATSVSFSLTQNNLKFFQKDYLKQWSWLWWRRASSIEIYMKFHRQFHCPYIFGNWWLSSKTTSTNA